MKKAALILLMSSTAFATPKRVIVPATAPSATARAKSVSHTPDVAENVDSDGNPVQPKAQVKSTTPSSTINQRTKMNPTVSASSAGYGTALAKRNPKASVTTNLPSEPGIKAPKFGDFELKAQLRNDLVMARPSELEDIGGKNFNLENEVRIGLKHKSGYGFSLTGTYATDNYADPSGNAGQSKDASLMLFHPSIVKTNTFDLYGYFRLYIPTSEKSREQDVRSGSYWSFLDITLPKKFSMTNLLISRVYTRPNPQPTDLNSLFYNSLELYHQTFKGISLAFGGQFEADNMYRNATGTEVDVYPFIDITLIPNVLIEPKYYFPVFVSGGGSVGASGAALNQTQAELFIKIAI
jgi:hypothetical protein